MSDQTQPRLLQTPCSLEAREEQYRKLNAQLDAKTAKLLREADQLLLSVRSSNSEHHEMGDEGDYKEHCPMQHSDHSDVEAEHISVPREEIQNTNPDCNLDYDPLPEPVNQLSLKAQNRCLRAKVRVLHEETQKLNQEMNNYREETNRLKKRVQELEEERTRLHRTTSSHSSQVERVKKSLEETKTQYAVVESERNTLKKECESAKRALSQQASELKSASTRLQRALEEVERLKNELDGLRSRNRDTNDDMKHTIERLTSDNRRLERQKTELIAAFKKQLRLIDVLRRQKMLIQASKCLQLTEEEFLKALDWKPS